MIRNLGQIIGSYVKMQEDHHESDYMNSLMDGSGECSHFWLDAQEREEQEFIEEAERATGRSWNQIINEVIQRTNVQWAHRYLI